MVVFIEQIVKKKYDSKDYLIFAGIGLGTLVLLFACFFVRILAGFGFILAIGLMVIIGVILAILFRHRSWL